MRNIFQRIDSGHLSLDHAAALIEESLSDAGYDVARQVFEVRDIPCANLVVEITGSAKPDEIVVVGAHYDSVSTTPGADDNASGVAVLLALARALADQPLERTLKLVAFANEEPPFFQSEEMGSWVYAQRAKQRNDEIVAMLSIESVGYFVDEPESQQYPFPFSLFYPSTGDFIAFVGNLGSVSLVRDCTRVFRSTGQLSSEGAAVPGWIPGVGWSDHWAFWKAGFDAVMVTDTAPFRNPNYHLEGDTPDTLDYERMARLTNGLDQVVRHLTLAR
ncbi:M28 family peptidase [Myxococcota bacterium]